MWKAAEISEKVLEEADQAVGGLQRRGTTSSSSVTRLQRFSGVPLGSDPPCGLSVRETSSGSPASTEKRSDVKPERHDLAVRRARDEVLTSTRSRYL